MGSSLNQHAAEFSLCNTLVLLLDLSFKQSAHGSKYAQIRQRRQPAVSRNSQLTDEPVGSLDNSRLAGTDR